MFGPILVPLDGSQLAECVLPLVVVIARSFNTKVVLLRMLENNQAKPSAQLFDLINWQINKSRAALYLEKIKTHFEESGLQVQSIVLEGMDAEGITDFAAIWTAWAFAKLGQNERAAELFHLLNPFSHSDSPEKVALYEVEPYVVAADIYSVAPHTGNGGWTWYTGSSGWMYRLGLEAILGITRLGNTLEIKPCIPRAWPGFKVDYRFGTSHYQIVVVQIPTTGAGENKELPRISRLTLDGNPVAEDRISMLDDGQQHLVHVQLDFVPPEIG